MKDKKNRIQLILFLLLGIILSACSVNSFDPVDLDLAHSYAAATLSTIKTEQAANQPSATQPNEEQPAPTIASTTTAVPSATTTLTATALPTQTFTATPTKTSTSTATPTKTSTSTATPTKTSTTTATKIPAITHTSTPLPTKTYTPTPIPTFTHTPIPCNQAIFLEHVNYPVGSVVLAGSEFTKSWQVKNTGSCTWTNEYALVFTSGNVMGAPLRIPLSEPVGQDETANLSISFKAPEIENIYSGTWALVDPDGIKIPFGQTKHGDLSVSIRVNILDMVVLDFSAAYCDASWRSQVLPTLPCPGDTDLPDLGYVIRLPQGMLENGLVVKDPILVTRPNDDLEGFISGAYPSIKVLSGDHFLATIGCSGDGDQCNLIFELNYQIGTGPIRKLSGWYEVHDGKVNEVLVDLSSLDGEYVNFVLTVRNNNTGQDNEGYWYKPRIMR